MAEHSSSPFQRRYPPELRERAVRMVLETASEQGERFGVVTRVAKQLERENRELRRANEILKSAAVFFGAELDRRSSR